MSLPDFPNHRLCIVACRDPQMWYAGKIGELVPFLGFWPDCYASREPAGYKNRVEFRDAELVRISPGIKGFPSAAA